MIEFTVVSTGGDVLAAVRTPSSAGSRPGDVITGAERRDRCELVLLLWGKGIEIGALNYPLSIEHNARIVSRLFVDRYRRADLLGLFGELAPVADQVPETDVLCDIIGGLAPFQNGCLDFVIACHLIEHVPDPIFLMQEFWRALRTGGRLFLAVPDKRYIASDQRRENTLLAHVIEDHRCRVRIAEDDHIEDCLRGARLEIPAEENARRNLFDFHRAQSLHLHVWDTPGFCEFLQYCLAVHSPFRLVDFSLPADNARREMIFVLEKLAEVPDLFDLRTLQTRVRNT